jgi:hypothetical protein
MRLHLEVEVISAHVVLVRIDEDGEVTVIVTDTGHILEIGNALDILENVPVIDGHLVTCFNCGIDLPEVQ